MKVSYRRTCLTCGRVFDLLACEIDASEWAYGHNCEPKALPVRTDDDGCGSWWDI